ncbi:MAG: aspartate dehydrogenase [Candidatus Omnitrophota bacterium]|jgi:aspartate dehydrogenase
MKTSNYRVKVCVVGCGAIGSRIAKSVQKELSKDCRITGIYDLDTTKTEKLAKSLKLNKNYYNKPLNELIAKSDCIVEAVNAKNTRDIIKMAIEYQKTVLVMSVGKMLEEDKLFKLARKNKCYILLPSGALAGVDAIKAASGAKITQINLVTRKPPQGLSGNPYFDKVGIDINAIKKETIVFDGNVTDAVKNFPQNINVAATLALAAGSKKNLNIKIVTSPKYTLNSHEVEVFGDFGSIVTKTENVPCPDNPKTSYLAVLSGIQTLKQYCRGILIGT